MTSQEPATGQLLTFLCAGFLYEDLHKHHAAFMWQVGSDQVVAVMESFPIGKLPADSQSTPTVNTRFSPG